MDSKILDQAYQLLLIDFPALSQFTIVRHGTLIYHRENHNARESLTSILFRRLVACWGALHGCPVETFHDHYQNRWNIRSAAKSVTSILVGIALSEGLFENLNQPIIDLLPEYFDNSNTAKRQITLRHLLTMTSGLCSVETGALAFQLLASRDWTRFMLGLPLVSQPGEKFIYNSANSHLLSAVISRQADKTLLEFARERLFSPLGINQVHWGAGPEEVTFGGGNLFLSSQEMAKLGLLYLSDGLWGERQLVPSNWIAESLQPHQVFLPTWDYGYYWYLHEEIDDRRQMPVMTFSAAGTGGQKLLVAPEYDLILTAVAKTDFVGERGIHLNRMVSQYLIPAICE
jgi:CubicO group peptidase (beta-lactamase class C family)